MKRKTLCSVFCAAVFAVCVTTVSAQQPDPATSKELLTVAAMPAGAVPLPQARSFVAANVEVALLAGAGPEDRFTLDVARDVTLTAVVQRVERRSETSYSVFGTLEGLENSSFIIAVENDAAAADIICAPQGLHYRFKSAGNGVHLICDVDDSAYARCSDARPPRNTRDEDFFPEAYEGLVSPPDGEQSGACSNVETVFDAMIVYTNLARIAAGGQSPIRAEIQLAVDATNEAYANSGIAARYRLVHREEVFYDEVGTYEDHLDGLTNSGGGSWPILRATRDAKNADFCTLWVDDAEACGLAWCTSDNGSAYSVVTWHCAVGNLSHPHEVGHNQGCSHDPENADCDEAFDYSFGHRFFGSDGLEYRSVMAYEPGTRIPFFSNPNVNFLGTPTGTATRDNTRTINDRRATCEAFQTTRYDIWVDFDFNGTPTGTFFNPYTTVTAGTTNIDSPGVGAAELPNLYIKEGSTSWTGTIDRAMRVSTCGGVVVIGE